MGKRAFVLAALVVTLVAQALPAGACSCIPGHTRDDFLDADGALIGAAISERPAEDDASATVYTLRVDEQFKGGLGETVDVYSETDNSCGLYLEPDAERQFGLLLYLAPDGGRWWSHSCAVVDPERLREIAAPLPEPDGRGPARLLAGGSWGEAGHLALDGGGRTLGYDLGDRSVLDLAACSGSPHFVELYLDRGNYVMALRRLVSNRAVWEKVLPLGAGEYAQEHPVEIACRGPGDPEVMVASRTTREETGHVLSYRDGERRQVYEGALYDAGFGAGGAVYVQRGDDGREVAEVDRRSGRARKIGTTAPLPHELAVSPDGKRLATFARDRVFVFDLRTGTRTRRGLVRHAFGEVQWMGNDRLVFFPSGPERYPLRFFDAGLSKATVVRGPWYSVENAIVGRTAYGLGGRRLLRVRLPGGPVQTIRRFEPRIHALAGVPLDVAAEVDWADS